MGSGKKLGRPSYGERKRVPWRAPEGLIQTAENHAQELGFKSLNEYLTQLVASATGYALAREVEEGLPFTDVA